MSKFNSKNGHDRQEDWDLWLERYRSDLELRGMRPRTIKDRTWLVSRFFTWCRPLSIESPHQMTLDILVDYRRFRVGYVNERGRRDTAFTINSHVLALRDFFKVLADRGAVPSALLSALKYMKEPKLLPKFTPSHQKVMKLLSTVPVDTPLRVRDRAILEVFYSSAIRREELANLSLYDLDIEGGLVCVKNGKGGKDRMAPIGAHAVQWLKRYLEAARPTLMGRNDEHGRVFVSKSGRPMHPNQVGIVVKRWGRVAGFEKSVGPHALRRSCATELIRAGANLGHVKDILGHEDYSSLKSYVQLAAVDLKEALRKFHPRERGNRD